MFSSRFAHATATLVTIIFLSITIGAFAQTDNKRDFGTLSCKEMMRLSGEDREIALAFAHGYMLGKKGTTQYEVDALAQITDQFIDHCLDNPTENALQSFEKLAK